MKSAQRSLLAWLTRTFLCGTAAIVLQWTATAKGQHGTDRTTWQQVGQQQQQDQSRQIEQLRHDRAHRARQSHQAVARKQAEEQSFVRFPPGHSIDTPLPTASLWFLRQQRSQDDGEFAVMIRQTDQLKHDLTERLANWTNWPLRVFDGTKPADLAERMAEPEQLVMQEQGGPMIAANAKSPTELARILGGAVQGLKQASKWLGPADQALKRVPDSLNIDPIKSDSEVTEQVKNTARSVVRSLAEEKRKSENDWIQQSGAGQLTPEAAQAALGWLDNEAQKNAQLAKLCDASRAAVRALWTFERLKLSRYWVSTWVLDEASRQETVDVLSRCIEKAGDVERNLKRAAKSYRQFTDDFIRPLHQQREHPLS